MTVETDILSPREALERLVQGGSLRTDETRSLFGQLMDGSLSEPMKAALLAALAVKGASTEEIAGAASAMRERVIAIPHHCPDAVDTCGTGGDGKGTFNISTAAALVAAAAGVPIAKHGNRSVSSRSGSADVLADLGVSLELGAEAAGRCLEEVGIAFLFAPRLHPAMAQVVPVRKELGIRTIFNVLGPLTNPAGAKRQLLGVFSERLIRPLAEVLGQLGSERAWVVHGSDGLDELTVTGPSRVAEWRDGVVREFEITPEQVGLERHAPEKLVGGEPQENAAMLIAVLEGAGGDDRSALRDVTVLNAGAALVVAGRVDDLVAGVNRAIETLDSGAARATLRRLVAFGERV